jgi:hypothetical protein
MIMENHGGIISAEKTRLSGNSTSRLVEERSRRNLERETLNFAFEVFLSYSQGF